jgi:hypothetical protein
MPSSATPSVKPMSEPCNDPAFVDSNNFANIIIAELPQWASAVSQSGARLD